MKNKIIRIISLAIIAILLVPSVLVFSVSEKTDEVGYESYTYWYEFTGRQRKAVHSKPFYEVDTYKTELELNGFSGVSKFTDVHSEGGYTYVLDGGLGRVLVMDADYNWINTIDTIKDENDNRYEFDGSSGVFVDLNGAIYIADTNHQRVLKCDIDGNLIRQYVLPDSSLIPTSFNYKPVRVAVDDKGYVYILSSGSYYGAILYSPTDEFLGFYGSNDVASTFTQALSTLWNRLFSNSDKKSGQKSVLPFTFNDLWVDDEGFIYTATGSAKLSQIKRLNPGGTNILDSAEVNFSDEGMDFTKSSGPRNQNIVGIAVDDNGFIYALDQKYGRVLVYDDNCTMITAFGGGLVDGNKVQGNNESTQQAGTFYTASAIALNGDDVIITDSYHNTVTVFNITEYGSLIKQAQSLTIIGDYEESFEQWQQVLKQDKNCQLAYSGLSKAYYVMGDNDKAIEYSKLGYDRATYALAFGSTRTDLIKDNFAYMAIALVLVIAAVVVLLVVSTKKKLRVIKNEKIHLATTMLTNPFDNFRTIKEKGLTSIPVCIVIAFLYYVFTVMQTTNGGFAFTYFDPESYNSMIILLRTIGIIALWTVTNWAVCTLFGGKGKLKEIFTVICYALIPSLVGSIIYVVITNVLTPDEGAFLNMFTTAALIYTFILLAVGSLIIHDFTFGKFIGTTLLTALGIGIVVFLIIMMIILLQQTWGFFATLLTEVKKFI